MNNKDHKSHVSMCYHIFKLLNSYIKRDFGQVQEALCVDKLIQGLQLHKNGDYEDPYYLYCELLDVLRYGTSIKE